jgi:hypothetical protein
MVGAKDHLHAVDGAVQSDPELLYILGQASLAARLQLKDFRGLIKLVYPSAGSKAILANTVFSTPYVTTRRSASTRSRDRGVFRFMTHMRVRRTVYANDPVLAESLIFEELRTLTDIDGADVAIDAGIGWADFVLSGTVQVERFDRFLHWLVAFNRMSIDSNVGGNGYIHLQRLSIGVRPPFRDCEAPFEGKAFRIFHFWQPPPPRQPSEDLTPLPVSLDTTALTLLSLGGPSSKGSVVGSDLHSAIAWPRSKVKPPEAATLGNPRHRNSRAKV